MHENRIVRHSNLSVFHRTPKLLDVSITLILIQLEYCGQDVCVRPCHVTLDLCSFFKGGSLEKGTSIKDTFDVDLVAFINKFDSVAEMAKNIDSVLAKLEEHIVHGDITWAKKIIFTRKSHRSVQFKITGHEGEELIDVDLLPAVDLGQGMPTDMSFFEPFII